MRSRPRLASLSAVGIMISSTGHAATFAWECRFPSFRNALTFVWDTDKSSASLTGGAGSVTLWPNFGTIGSGQAVVSFAEPTSGGAIQTTTIIVNTGEAIHSRNAIVGGKFVPSQDSGQCRQRR